MPDYLLPCTCGRKMAVSTAQAGQTVSCQCGAALQVPTMRALGKLERAAASGAAGRRGAGAWEGRHRAAYLLVLGIVACLGAAAYLWVTLPPKIRYATPQQIAEAVENATPAETVMLYLEMSKGLPEETGDRSQETRRRMLWGIGIAVTLAALQAGAIAAVLGRNRRRGQAATRERKT